MTRVFISYKREDEIFARRLREQLHAWDYSTWMDIFDIPKGAYWPDEIDKGLDSADIVLGIMSAETFESRNVKNEWDWAIQYERPLIPIKRQSPKRIPHRYISINYIDFSQDEQWSDLQAALATQHTLYKDELIVSHLAGNSSLKFSAKASGNVSNQLNYYDSQTQILPDDSQAAGNSRTRQAMSLSTPPTTDRNREAMIQKVREYWIDGVLKPTLHGGSIDIGLQIKPDAVLKHRDYGDYDLPENPDILQIFEDMNRELLILGAPGAGKTTLMLQLAEKLLDQATGNEKQPIPVVLNLSSWAAKREPLDKWLQEHLRQEYQVPRNLARQWVENPTLLMLLDGMDEVAEAFRNECVEAINVFRREYMWVDVVVCSRIEEYERLTSQLDLRGAVVLQPLTDVEIESYLSKPELEDVRELVRTDPIVREMVETPFLLNAMSVTAPNVLAGYSSREIKLKSVLSNFVIDHYQINDLYTFKNVSGYLTWLAKNLVQQSKIIFHIEEIQPVWIISEQSRKSYGRLLFTVLSLIILLLGLIQGIIAISVFAPNMLPGIKAAYGFSWGVCGLLAFSIVQIGTKRLARFFSPLVTVSLITFLVVPIILIVAGFLSLAFIIAWSIIYLEIPIEYWSLFFSEPISNSTGIELVQALLIHFAASVALSLPAYGMFSIIVGSLSSLRSGIVFMDRVDLGLIQRKHFTIEDQEIWNGIIIGTFAACIVLLAFSFSFVSQSSSRIVFLTPALINSLIIGLAVLIFLIIFFRVRSRTKRELIWLKQSVRPNESTWRALRLSTIILLVGTFSTSILFLTIGLFTSMFPLAFAYGGLAVIQHFVLRLILYRSGDIPWNYAKFFDYCAEIGLMRKVGGGYIFVHRYLLEYFAGLEDESA